jgi:hypothetical protein
MKFPALLKLPVMKLPPRDRFFADATGAHRCIRNKVMHIHNRREPMRIFARLAWSD